MARIPPQILGVTSWPSDRPAARGFRAGERVWARLPYQFGEEHAAPRSGTGQVMRALATVLIAPRRSDPRRMTIHFDFGAEGEINVLACFHDNQQYHAWMEALARREPAQQEWEAAAKVMGLDPFGASFSPDPQVRRHPAFRRYAAAQAVVYYTARACFATNPYR